MVSFLGPIHVLYSYGFIHQKKRRYLIENILEHNKWLTIGVLILGAIILWILNSWVNTIFSLAIFGITFLFAYFIISLIRPELIIYFAIFICGLSGSLPLIRYDFLPLSFSGILTFILLASTIVAILLRLKYKSTFASIKTFRNFYPVMFLLLFGSIISPYFVEGLRLSFLFITPILVGILAKREMIRSPGNRYKIEKALIIIPLLPITIILINLFAGTLETTTRGFRTIFGLSYSPRTLALFLLPILALFVAKWRYDKNIRSRITSFVGTITLTAIIITSLSRAASVIALVIILPSRFIRKWYKPSTLFTFLFGLVVLFYWVSIPSVQMRFFPNGIGSIKLNIESFRLIDTQGRRNLWAVTWQNAIDKPFFGHGTGSAGQLIYSTYPPLEHPHNDYLRVFHDTGIVGLFLFGVAWILQIFHHWKGWIYYDRRRNQQALYHFAALIATIAICISFLTDNTMTYVFVLIPLFIIYGLADSPIMEVGRVEASFKKQI